MDPATPIPGGIDPFVSLPPETILEIAQTLSDGDIVRWCQTSTKFRDIVCGDGPTIIPRWSTKFVRFFNRPLAGTEVIDNILPSRFHFLTEQLIGDLTTAAKWSPKYTGVLIEKIVNSLTGPIRDGAIIVIVDTLLGDPVFNSVVRQIGHYLIEQLSLIRINTDFADFNSYYLDQLLIRTALKLDQLFSYSDSYLNYIKHLYQRLIDRADRDHTNPTKDQIIEEVLTVMTQYGNGQQMLDWLADFPQPDSAIVGFIEDSSSSGNQSVAHALAELLIDAEAEVQIGGVTPEAIGLGDPVVIKFYFDRSNPDNPQYLENLINTIQEGIHRHSFTGLDILSELITNDLMTRLISNISTLWPHTIYYFDQSALSYARKSKYWSLFTALPHDQIMIIGTRLIGQKDEKDKDPLGGLKYLWNNFGLREIAKQELIKYCLTLPMSPRPNSGERDQSSATFLRFMVKHIDRIPYYEIDQLQLWARPLYQEYSFKI